MRTATYNLNLRVGAGIPPIVKVSQNDEGRSIGFRLFDGALAFFPGATAEVTITGTKPSGLGFTETCSVSGSVAVVETTLAMTQESGQINAELRISDGTLDIGTTNFVLSVEPAPHPAGTTDGTTEEARTVLEQCEEYAQIVQEAAESATEDYTEVRSDVDQLKADLGDVENAVFDDVASASVTEDISNTYNGVTFEYVDDGTLKLYGTATANRRCLCLNGQNSVATSQTAFAKTLEQGKYKITTGVTGFLSANDNFSWQCTYTTFANAITAVTKKAPEATVELTQPAMVGFSFNSGCNFGTSGNPTYVTISVEKVVSKLDNMLTKAEYDSTGIIMRGNVVALGYNSFADCTLPGLYTFTTANLASISDSPAGFSAGGILLTTINGTVVWQEIKSSFESFIRYGYTGTWQKSKKSLYVKYTSTASTRDDKDVAQISVDIPTDVIGRKVRYEMGHCVDASKNADTWRLMYLYYVLSNGNANQMNRKGEFECAIHLANRPDFSGGVTHGDEIDQNVTFFVDGKRTLPENVSGFCDKFRVVRNAILYDPNDSTTPIANHGCEYIFTKDGLTINQSVKWLVSESLTNCFLAMLPIYKTYSTYRYDNVNFEAVENTDTNYSVTIPDATSVTEYNSDISTTMEIGVYPKGLSGGDCALITDNNGLNYNKVYFPVCTGGSSQIGDLWKATTKFFCR